MKVMDHLHFGISSSIKEVEESAFCNCTKQVGIVGRYIFLTLTICGIMNSFFFFFHSLFLKWISGTCF